MFDYVIVGAGSAGCALAARLTEDPEVSVALVEAGPADTVDEVHIPAAFPSLFKGPLDWDYDTEPEPGIDGRRAFPAAVTLRAGSSATEDDVRQLVRERVAPYKYPRSSGSWTSCPRARPATAPGGASGSHHTHRRGRLTAGPTPQPGPPRDCIQAPHLYTLSAPTPRGGPFP